MSWTGFEVRVYESERGWGTKLDFVVRFELTEHDKALAYVADFNKDNTETVVPDWYMVAREPVVVTLPNKP